MCGRGGVDADIRPSDGLSARYDSRYGAPGRFMVVVMVMGCGFNGIRFDGGARWGRGCHRGRR